MASNESNAAVKHSRGEMSKHFWFVFKLTSDGKVDNARKSARSYIMSPVKGQCTLSGCTDVNTGSHACFIEAQEEYYQNIQIKLGELAFNTERIGERFDDADESGKILSKQQCHDLLNVCQNLSVKIDALGETANGEDKCFVDKNLDQMLRNLSLRLEIIDEKFQSTDKSLLLLSKAEQNIKESLKGHDQILQAMHRNTTDGIDGIHKKIDNAVQSIKERIQSHDLSLQRLDQNISTEVERIDGRLQSLFQQVGEIYQLLKNIDCPKRFPLETEQSVSETPLTSSASFKELTTVSSEKNLELSRSATQSSTYENRFTSRAIHGMTTTNFPSVSTARACHAIVSSAVNLALGRSVTQSSTLHNYDAIRAVDGNKETSFGSASCSHTDDRPGGPNWWRVRLDRPYRVQKVTVTNRGDCCESRLDYFIVGVTNSVADPVRGAYPLCGQYPSTVARGATVTLYCDLCISAGQYVIIQQPSNGNGYLTLCEVEVYGGRG